MRTSDKRGGTGTEVIHVEETATAVTVPLEHALDEYHKEHPDPTQAECVKNLGISVSTLARWESQHSDHDGDIPVRGSSNYESDEAKESLD